MLRGNESILPFSIILTPLLLSPSQLCRLIDCGRVTSCKSAKDRTAMSVTLEEAHILLQEMQMESSSFQQALDDMRR